MPDETASDKRLELAYDAAQQKLSMGLLQVVLGLLQVVGLVGLAGVGPSRRSPPPARKRRIWPVWPLTSSLQEF